MVWRIPTRDIGGVPYDEGLELPPEYITRDESNYLISILCVLSKISPSSFSVDFDAIDEITGNMGGLKLPPAQQSSREYGAYLHKLPKPQCKGFLFSSHSA